MRKVTPTVEKILRDYPQTRSSDKLLLLYVWHNMGLILTEKQMEKFMDMPSTETIRRIRQKIQENGQYLATDRIRRERHIKSLEVQQNEPTAQPKRLEQVLEQRSML